MNNNEALIALASNSSSVYSLLNKADIKTVKDILRNAEGKVWKQVDGTRAEMLKYLENKCEIGEGNEWLHKESKMWKEVEGEAFTECSSFKSCLHNCVAIVFMEQEGRL